MSRTESLVYTQNQKWYNWESASGLKMLYRIHGTDSEWNIEHWTLNASWILNLDKEFCWDTASPSSSPSLSCVCQAARSFAFFSSWSTCHILYFCENEGRYFHFPYRSCKEKLQSLLRKRKKRHQEDVSVISKHMYYMSRMHPFLFPFSSWNEE